jgi:hypothetical protein
MTTSGFSETTIPARGSGTAWVQLIEMFRSLGGTIENIGEDPESGGGLFVIDPSKPILLRIPENLLFSAEDVQVRTDRIALGEYASVGGPERQFFDAYASAVGSGRPLRSARFIAAFDALPPEVRELLGAHFGMGDLFQGDSRVRARNWLVNRHAVTWDERAVVAPFLELMDDAADGLSWRADPRGFLHVEGQASDEIFVNRGPRDSLGFFRKYGVAGPQPQAYSLSSALRLDAQTLAIGRNMGAFTLRGGLRVPQLQIVGDTVFLSYLMVGSPRFPRLSRGIFRSLMRDAGISDADERFDELLYFNRNRFLGLLGAIEPYEGAMIATLRQVARFQLETMSHCVGAREL